MLLIVAIILMALVWRWRRSGNCCWGEKNDIPLRNGPRLLPGVPGMDRCPRAVLTYCGLGPIIAKRSSWAASGSLEISAFTD